MYNVRDFGLSDVQVCTPKEILSIFGSASKEETPLICKHWFDEVTAMKQITNKEYEEWQKYKAEKAKGHVLLPDTVRFICEANGFDAEKIGQHFLEILPKICPPEER